MSISIIDKWKKHGWEIQYRKNDIVASAPNGINYFICSKTYRTEDYGYHAELEKAYQEAINNGIIQE